MTAAVGNFLLGDDIELMRAFPATTSAANAAGAISRAIYTSRHDKLSPEALDAVKRTLAALNSGPALESLAGLVEAAEHGIGAVDLETFVLSSGVWRTLLGLINVEKNNVAGETILHIVQLAISSATPLLIPEDPKLIRIAKFFLTNAIKFTQALGDDTIRDPNTTSAAFLLYGKVVERKLLQDFRALVLKLLKEIFQRIPVKTWKYAFDHNSKEEEASYGSFVLALYFVRCAIGDGSGKEDDMVWKKKCAETLATQMLPYLFDSFATLKPASLVEKRLDGASMLSVMAASIVSACLYLDAHDGGALELLLCKVSSACVISSLVASFALAELSKYRDAAGRKRIRDLVRQCRDLSNAVHSLHATQRWAPLVQRLENGKKKNTSVTTDFASAGRLPVLLRARLIHQRNKPTGADPKVRAGLLVTSSPVSQAFHTIVRSALDEKNTDKDISQHLTLLSKYIPYL